MAKCGVLHDYDLWANKEASARNQTCAVCEESPMFFQWSDYSGEAMCMKCGCPYQLKWGSDKQVEENNYPYLNISPEAVPALKEYWEKTKKFVCHGQMMGNRVGAQEFYAWIEKKYPELLQSKEA